VKLFTSSVALFTIAILPLSACPLANMLIPVPMFLPAPCGTDDAAVRTRFSVEFPRSKAVLPLWAVVDYDTGGPVVGPDCEVGSPTTSLGLDFRYQCSGRHLSVRHLVPYNQRRRDCQPAHRKLECSCWWCRSGPCRSSR